jgi:hypothetical protein
MRNLSARKLAVMFVLMAFSLAATSVQAQKKSKGKKKKAKEATEEVAPAEGEGAPAEGEGGAAAGESEAPVETGPGAPGEGGAAGEAPATGEGGLTEAEIIQKAGAYSVKLRDLEQKVNQLKEKIFRSKARLSLLAEKVLAGPAGAGARATIIYSDKMGGSFKLIKAVFILDGVPIFNKSDQKGMKKKKGLQLFSAPIVPGEHTLSVNVEYKGNGYGLFAYLNDYRFKVRSSTAFSVDEGKSKQLEIVIYEKGNIATPLEERPAIKYVEQGGEFSQ